MCVVTVTFASTAEVLPVVRSFGFSPGLSPV